MTGINHIQNQFKEHINISEEVVSFIASEAKTNIRELIGVLNRVIAFSRLHKRVLNINDCKNILKDVFNQIRVITVDKIQNVVSNYFNIALSEMLSQRRSRPLARPRQIAMYLAKKMTTRSLPEIGRRFANRDHTTVIHAVKTITKLSEKDEEMKKELMRRKHELEKEAKSEACDGGSALPYDGRRPLQYPHEGGVSTRTRHVRDTARAASRGRASSV